MTNKSDICEYVKDIQEDRYNCIYLIYLSDIGQKGEKVYKYGRTYDSEHRFLQYPKNSTLLYLVRVKDCFHAEDQIYKMFLTYFEHKEEYGREYFQTDDVKLMIRYMNHLIDHMKQRLDDDMVEIIKNKYKKWLKFKVYEYDDISDDFSNELVEDYADDKTDYTIKENRSKNIFKQNIKKSINIIDTSDETIKQKVLYDKEEKLTNKENKILILFKSRAEFLGIDYNKKKDKKKNEEYISDDNKFTILYSYKLLVDSDIDDIDKIDHKDVQSMYNILNAKNLLAKIKLIKQLEDILGIKTLEIDTIVDVKRFDENVVIKNKLKNTIKKIFRSNRNIKEDDYKTWYYQLIQMYKNILGLYIFNKSNAHHNGTQYWKYNINNDFINKYQDLFP
jgi:hypothetical protein